MLKNAAKRERHSVGNSFEEINKLAQKIGYPIHLVPFGHRDCVVKIRNDEELAVKAKDVIEKGFWNLVHVLKPLVKHGGEL